MADLETLDQNQLDKLKYLEVPDEVWLQIKSDLEELPALLPVQPPTEAPCENTESENRFKAVSSDDLNEIAAENTNIQTKWAVKTFRGKTIFF